MGVFVSVVLILAHHYKIQQNKVQKQRLDWPEADKIAANEHRDTSFRYLGNFPFPVFININLVAET